VAQPSRIFSTRTYHFSLCNNISDYKEKESQALFRALNFGESKNSEQIIDDTEKEEKFTLDDFFSNMEATKGKPKKNHRKQAHSRRRRGKTRKSSKQAYTEDSGDLGSFFDEVDSIMKKNKLKSETADSINNIADTPSDTPKTSIFDILQTTSKQRSPNAYDEESFDQYIEMLERVTSTSKFLRKHTRSPVDDEAAKSIFEWLRSEEPVVSCDLPTLDQAMKGEIAEESQAVEHFRKELSSQKQKLMDFYSWDQQQYTVAISALLKLGGLCAKNASGAPLDIAWQKLKEAGYKMDKDMLHNYLYVSSTFSNRSIQLPSTGGSLLDFLKNDSESDKSVTKESTFETDEINDSIIDIASEVALVQDYLYSPSEQSTSIRVRMLVKQGRAKEAERLLDTNAVSCVLECI
jgi:hypothetical protein